MSNLSDALAAMDKATPGPWVVLPLEGKYYGTRVEIGENTVEVWTPDHFAIPFASDREIARGYDVSEGSHDHVEDSASLSNAIVIAAAPGALAWIKEALPYLEGSKKAIEALHMTTLGNYNALCALIARAKPEEVGNAEH